MDTSFGLNKKSQAITLIVILSSFIGIIIVFAFGATSNIYLMAFLALVLFIISFVNTDIAIIFIILSTFLLPAVKIGQTTLRELTIRPEDVLLLVVIAGWIAKMAIYKEIAFLKHTRLNKPIIAYSMLCLASTFLALADGRKNPQDAFFYLLKYFEYFLLFFMVVNNCKSASQAKRFINFLLLTFLLVSLLGLQQIPGGVRVSAPIGENEPNTLSGYFILMIALNLGLLLHAQSGTKRLLYFFLFALSFLPFLFTLSRGGMFAFLPMLFTLILFTKKLKIPLMITAILFVVGLPVLLPSVVQRRLKDTFAPETNISVMGKKIPLSESASARLNSWNYAFANLKEHPLVGVGVPGGGVVDGQFPRVLMEVGLTGLAFFLWIISALFKIGFLSYRNTTHNPFMQGISLGFIAGVTGLLFHSLSAATFIIIRIMQPFWILAGVIAVLPEIEKENLESVPEST